MKRKFNDAGLCVPQLYYMGDTSEKIEKILQMVEAGEYFAINRPRQFGKTTILSLLARRLNERDDCVAYLRPIINGKSFDFKEPNVADERRMDIVITYCQKRYVVE